MAKSRGFRRKTRSLMRKKPRERGKLKLSRILYNYEIGDKVVIRIDPSFHKGMPHRRYHGKIGIIEGKRGKAYEVAVTQGKAIKHIVVLPEHFQIHEEG